jgi:hypothetical protein
MKDSAEQQRLEMVVVKGYKQIARYWQRDVLRGIKLAGCAGVA